jgi:FixJ family two-component response regulator
VSAPSQTGPRIPEEPALSGAVVFIMVDNADVSRALAGLLGTAGYQTCLCSSAVAFFEKHDSSRPGCILLDMELPDCSGLEVQTRLGVAGCDRPIVCLTDYGTIEIAVSALRAGAVDVLTKPVSATHLFEAIHAALRLDAVRRTARSDLDGLTSRFKRLTPRERQVFRQLLRGRMNKQIAADLGTGEKTIKVHRARLMFKLGTRSIPQLVTFAQRIGVLEPMSVEQLLPPKNGAGARP